MIGARSRAPVRLFHSDRAIADRNDRAGHALAFSALALSLSAHWLALSVSDPGGSLTLGAAPSLRTSIQFAAPSVPAEPLAPAPLRVSPHPDRVAIERPTPMPHSPMPQPSMTAPQVPHPMADMPPPEPVAVPDEIMEPTPPVLKPVTATAPEPVEVAEVAPTLPPFQPQAKPAEPPRPQTAVPPAEPVADIPQQAAAPAIEQTPPDPQAAATTEPAQSATAEPTTQTEPESTATAGGAPSAEPVLVTEPRFRTPPTPPTYPPVARRRNEEGVVVLRALVSPGGDTQRIEVWQTSGFYRLDDAARAAVADWHFEPARRAGLAVASWVQVPIRFQLD
ncbi:MAG: TonB family protein [Alphaproteobacteria bacterium]|nr:TonB family protein [Alphaproteobacteria bacterium]MBO6863342.1 TonB family protein [Alphaproteobacteria bacterium]